MLGSVARQMTLHSIIYKRKKGLLQPAHDGGKPLNQAVSALLPTGNRARTAYLHCIKLSTNIEPFSGSGTTIIAAEQTERKCYAMELSPFLYRNYLL
jgi:hypothetical protein